MNRTGLLVVLGIAAAVGLLFGVFPALDLALAGLFYDPARGGFWMRFSPVLQWTREVALWLIALLAVGPMLAWIVKLVLPRRPMVVPGRAILFLLMTMLLGPGLVANSIFKENWGRPRPIDVPQFGGNEPFKPWWDPRGVCPKNCSFIAGESSGAFWTMAPASLTPPPWRALAYAGAITFGIAIGILRMAAGGHFASDVAFSAVFMFMVIWLMHGLLYRWRGTRPDDAMFDRAFESVALPVHAWLARRFKGST